MYLCKLYSNVELLVQWHKMIYKLFTEKNEKVLKKVPALVSKTGMNLNRIHKLYLHSQGQIRLSNKLN